MNLYEISNSELHTFPVVVSIPHSGTYIPKNIKSTFKNGLILPSTDWHLPKLYSFLPQMGVTSITSLLSRYVVDLNVSPTKDLDSGQFPAVFTHTTFGKPIYNEAHSPLQDYGVLAPKPFSSAPRDGVLNLLTGRTQLTKAEMQRRITKYHKPYHNALHQLLREKLHYFPYVYLLDLHSFFSNPTTQSKTEDILLHDHHHASANISTTDVLSGCFGAEGYRVAELPFENDAYIISHAARVMEQRGECVQIKLNYKKYIENRVFGEEENPGYDSGLFDGAQQQLYRVFEKACTEFRARAHRKYV